MRIKLNGEMRGILEGETLAALLRRLNLPEKGIAVERNRLIVPPSQYGVTRLAAGDHLEIVDFVGGG